MVYINNTGHLSATIANLIIFLTVSICVISWNLKGITSQLKNAHYSYFTAEWQICWPEGQISFGENFP